MADYQHPQMSNEKAAFVASMRDSGNREALEKKLREALIEDPEIQDATNLSATIEREKGDTVARLLGKVKTELEKARAEELVRNNVPADVEIDNQLTVG